MHAAGAGFVDWLITRGEYQVKPDLPFIPGTEIAGVVLGDHMDVDIARAAKCVVVTAEQIVDTAEIVRNASDTMLPHFTVDAVVHQPFGAYPGECYGLYEADMAHLDSYVRGLRELGPQAQPELRSELMGR